MLALLPARRLWAQTCFRGRPLPTCQRFWVTETGFGQRVNRFSPFGESHDQLASVEVGRMWNRGRAVGVGGTVFVGVGDQITGNTGVLLALKPRFRRWLGRSLSWDVSAGPGMVVLGDAGRGRLVLTGHTGLMLGDLVGVTAQVLVGPTPGYPKPGPTKAGLYLGGKLGSYPGVVSGILAPLAGLVLALTVLGSGD